MSAGYQREPVARCHETHTSQVVSAAASAAVCGAVDVVVGVAAVISVVVVVVVAVAVHRLQRRRVSAHGMTNGTQELESSIRPVDELGQTGLDCRLIYDVSFAFWAAYV